MDCPEPSQIATLVNGAGVPLDLGELEQHLAGCLDCASVVAAALSASWSSREAAADETTALSLSIHRDAGTVSTGPTEGIFPTLRAGVGIIPAGTRLGRYRVRRWLGRGGMGEVYEGYDPELDRRVALKLLRLRGRSDLSAQRRLRREAQTLARLSSPHVVAALDVGTFGDQLFLVMELIEGPTLATWLASQHRPWREILDVFLAAGEGIAVAHDVGVIHRDFKPQNVLIGGDGNARVSDFGLARDADEPPVGATGGWAEGDQTETERTALTQTGMVIGTPRYMAPEQFLRRPLDVRVDQFSFCVALYEALFGSHPFAARPSRGDSRRHAAEGSLAPVQSLESLRTAVLSGVPTSTPARSLVPRSVVAVLRRGLARSPEDRYPTLRELLSALRQARSTRRRSVARLVTAALVILLAGAGALFWRSTRRSDLEVLEATGQPADWGSTPVLARTDGMIHCIQRLDDRTLRMIWGTPHRAEDIDIATAARRPTNLVPESYLHGCPALSRDGRQILFEGYDAHERAHIFHASNATGEGAEALVTSAEPTFRSEPRWLSSGDAFVFDLDAHHPAIFNTRTNAIQVLPGRAKRDMTSSGFYKAVDSVDRIVVTEPLATQQAHVSTYDPPHFELGTAFRVKTDWNRGWISDGARGRIFGIGVGSEGRGIGMFALTSRRLVHLAEIAGRTPEAVEALGNDLAILTSTMSSQIWYRGKDGSERMLVDSRDTSYESESMTANGDILAVRVRSGVWDTVLVRTSDGTIRELTKGPVDSRAAALPNGEWLLARNDPVGPQRQGLFRCSHVDDNEPGPCQQLSRANALSLAAAPDGRTVAYVALDGQGIALNLVDLSSGRLTPLVRNATMCRPVWTSPRLIWVSVRKGSRQEWTEFDIGSGSPTGRSRSGTTTCFDRREDPASPSTGPVRIVTTDHWDVRLHPLPP